MKHLVVSYPSKNRRLVNLLGEDLFHNLRCIDDRYELWQDTKKLEIGTDWDREIRTAMKSADAGILMLCPAFFASEYIKTVELKLLEGKPLLPVMVKDLAANPLGHLQAHYLKGDRFKDKTYEQCNSQQRTQFASELATAIHRRLTAKGGR